jgi:protein O-GlcNAc transferase
LYYRKVTARLPQVYDSQQLALLFFVLTIGVLSTDRRFTPEKDGTTDMSGSLLSGEHAKRRRRFFIVPHRILCTFALFPLASAAESAPAVSASLEQGIQLLQSHRYAEALDWFGKARQQDPHDADVELLSGLASWALKRPSEAIEHFQRSIELRPSAPSARMRLCNAYWELKRFAEAVTACQNAAEAAPTLSSALDTAGTALFELGRLEEARRMFLQAIAVSPSAAVYYNLSGTQAEMGQLNEAVESVRAAIRLRPDFAEARIKLGFYLIALRSYRESIETLKQVTENNPDDERAYLGIAVAEMSSGHFDKGIYAARKATTLRPSLARAHYVLGILEFETGDTSSALAVQETLRLLDPALAEDYGRYLRSRYVVPAGVLGSSHQP